MTCICVKCNGVFECECVKDPIDDDEKYVCDVCQEEPQELDFTVKVI